MPLQNRVLPTAEIVAIAARGTLTGNRGILHGPDRRLGAARWRHRRWICCALSFRGRRRSPMTPGHWTELFFLDEAVALAAGHRPCATCRRADYRLWCAAWALAFDQRDSADAMDLRLHEARLLPRSGGQRRIWRALDDLPDGAFVLWDGAPHLVLGPLLFPFAPQGYGAPLPRPAAGSAGGAVAVLTPAPTLAVLAAGYRARLHSTAAPCGAAP